MCFLLNAISVVRYKIFLWIENCQLKEQSIYCNVLNDHGFKMT